ncbi:GAF domain-containing protein [Mucilaginibacter xinganensis]|uniref:histidine kinase n=1 Tax=Mucilaginibacter xinganensis TaxID=1234841 RepID=A0A223NTC9_9SPHI|nr:GAF domain-containing protein [Mucilaginibacter xinganensis]ASU32934.1 hypothetical protein MuYL_1034 [Mucilaginibacter xinganensis]
MPQKELERLQAVNRFLKLDFVKERELQEIVMLAAKICGTPTALITLIDEATQYIRFSQTFNYESTQRKDAFCNHVIGQDCVMVVPDALLDRRFEHNPLVNEAPFIRFYAGAPLITQDGHKLGSLCVINQVPGQLSENQQHMLQALARQVIQLMEFDASLTILKEQFVEAKRLAIELRSFFESSIDCHLLLGENFEIMAFNKAWESQVRKACRSHPAKGKSMIDYLDAENLSLFYRDYRRALKGTAVYDERNLKQDGKDCWQMVKFEPAFDADGKIIGVSFNSSDITKKVEHQQTVISQNAQLNEIAFIQSHELRRPVASIMGLMKLLKMDGRTDDIEEWQLLEVAVQELDDKIRMIVEFVNPA